MRQPCYRITEPVKRIAMHLMPESDDRRDPETIEEYSVKVRESVRAMRVADLERTWAERYLSAFDRLMEMWHPMDPTLYLHLSDPPWRRAVEILRRAGWL